MARVQKSIIYTLTDPRDGQVKYVGKVLKIEYLRGRFTKHMNVVETTKKCRWVQSLKAKGLKPIMEIIDEVQPSEVNFWETYWICQMKAFGFNLKNMTPGGDGKPKGSIPWNKGKTNVYSKETKERISDTAKRRFLEGNSPSAKLTNEQHQEVCIKYQGGVETKYLAETYGVSSNQILCILRLNNVKARGNRGKMIPEMEMFIVNYFYGSNKKLNEIADDFNVNISTVAKTLRKNGISPRGSRFRLNVSAETRKKQSDFQKKNDNTGRFRIGIISHNAMPVKQLTPSGELIKVWDSINMAKVELGVKNIYKVIKGERPLAGGFKWVR